MKKSIAVIVALMVMMSLYSFCFASTEVVDQKSGIAVSVPDNTVILTADNIDDNREILYKIGKSSEEMTVLFESGYAFYAFTKDEKHIISLSSVQNDLSLAAGDLISLDDTEKQRVIKALCGDIESTAQEYSEIEKGGAYFCRIITRDEEKNLPSVYYITILNGYCVTLSLDSMVPELTENAVSMIDTAFSSMKFSVRTQQVDSDSAAAETMTWLIWTAIVIMIALAVWAVVSMILEVHRQKMETNWQQKVRKKPRR